VQKISSPPGFDPRTVQPVASRHTISQKAYLYPGKQFLRKQQLFKKLQKFDIYYVKPVQINIKRCDAY
jgi:hypothetical protein